MFVDALPSTVVIRSLVLVSVNACNGVDLYVPLLSTTNALSLSFVSSNISSLNSLFVCLSLNVLSALFAIVILSPSIFASIGKGSVFLTSLSNTINFSPLPFCTTNAFSLPITSLLITFACSVPLILMFTTSLFLNLGAGNNLMFCCFSNPCITDLEPLTYMSGISLFINCFL